MIKLSKIWLFVLLSSIILCACNSKPSVSKSKLSVKNFKTLVDGKSTGLYILKNKSDMEVCVTDYGGRIVSLMVPDKNGKPVDVVLGFDSISDYLRQSNDFGAIIGRCSGYIKAGRLVIGKDIFHLTRNASNDCLDGGEKGFQTKVFDAQQIGDSKLVLTYISKNADEGFPGNLVCSVTYKLTDDNALDIEYSADTDRPTVVNLSNRIYFNLSGDGSLSNNDEYLYMQASYYLPIDDSFVPNGKIAKVKGTPMDFLKFKSIEKNINDGAFQQIRNGQGYNHYFILDTKKDISRISAELFSSKSGIVLSILTDEPGIYFYSGNQLDGTMRGKNNKVYDQRTAVVLSPQHFSDAVNHSEWPSAILKPGQKYKAHTIYKFSIKK